MTDPKGPIGIFDSGIGGLTVAAAVRDHLPNHSLIYFGDTAHLPYGDKSASSIESYIKAITVFLEEQGCVQLVVACNSASSVLKPHMISGSFEQVINVIDPVVEDVCANQDVKRVGVIGTRRTIKSGVYKAKINLKRPDIEVFELETPLLAPMIEEGFIMNEVASTVIHEYLEEFNELDALILGCTHYPLIREQIALFLGPNVLLYDAPSVVARTLEHSLSSKKMSTDNDHFYVSDFTGSFEKTARLFFGHSIKLEEKRLD